LAYLTAVAKFQLNGSSVDHAPGAGVRHPIAIKEGC